MSFGLSRTREEGDVAAATDDDAADDDGDNDGDEAPRLAAEKRPLLGVLWCSFFWGPFGALRGCSLFYVGKASACPMGRLCCLIVSLTVWMLQRAAQNGLLETREVSDRYWKATGNTDPVDRRHPSQSMDQTLETINREQGKPETQSRERRTEQDREAPEDASLTAALDPPTPLQHPAQRAHRIQPTTNAAPDGWWSETTIILEGQDLEDARSFFLCVSSECCTPTNPAGPWPHGWGPSDAGVLHTTS